MSLRLTILCENSVGRPIPAIGEHGFACLVETPCKTFLFDTGQGLGIVHNASLLGKNFADINGIILSHGHFDHTGGLQAVLRKTGPIDVFAHPDVFTPRFWEGLHERRENGIPFARLWLESLGARFRWVESFQEIARGVWLTGEVPRRTGFEPGDPHLVVALTDGGKSVPDPLRDDLSLVIDTEKGLVLLLGCAHAGVVNIMRHVADRLGRDRFFAVVGGTHLAPADDGQFEKTLQAFRDFGVERIGLSHCTGQIRGGQIFSRFPNRTFFASVGSTLEV